MKSEYKKEIGWIDVTDQYTAAAKEQYEERQWEPLAESFSIWAWGKEIPIDMDKMKEFFMRFVNEANHGFNPPTKK